MKELNQSSPLGMEGMFNPCLKFSEQQQQWQVPLPTLWKISQADNETQ